LQKFHIKEIITTLISLFFLAIFLHVGRIGCPIRRITHIPCPACGMNRAFLSFIKGDLHSYFYFNAFALPVGMALILLLASKIIPKSFFYLGLTILALNFFYYIYRLFFGFIP